MSWIAYKYLCPLDPDPWVKIAESSDSDVYYINKKTAYYFQHPYYGSVFTALASKVSMPLGQSSPDYLTSDETYLYVSCSKKKLQMYVRSLQPRNEYIELDDPNPGSVGDGILSVIC